MLDKYEKIPEIPEVDEEQNLEYVTIDSLNKILEEKMGEMGRKRKLGAQTTQEFKENKRSKQITTREEDIKVADGS